MGFWIAFRVCTPSGEHVTTPVELASPSIFLPLTAAERGLAAHVHISSTSPSQTWIGVKVSNGLRAHEEGFPGAQFLSRLQVGIWAPPLARGLSCVAAPAPGLSHARPGEGLEHPDLGLASWTFDLVGKAGAWMPSRAIFNRRFGVAPSAEGAAHQARFGLWTGLHLARSQPTNSPLPESGTFVTAEGLASALKAHDEALLQDKPAAVNIAPLAVHMEVLGRGSPLACLGDPLNTGEPGGYALDPFPGWEGGGSAGYALRTALHDRNMEGSPIACWDSEGEPVYLGPAYLDEYRLSRGWSKTTQLATICEPQDNPYDSRLAPKVAHDVPVTGEVHWLPEDWQHGIRLVSHGIGALDWLGDAGDPLIERDLAMHAMECLWSYRRSGPKPAYGYAPLNMLNLQAEADRQPGMGRPSLGREFGWVAYFLGWVMRQPWSLGQKRLLDEWLRQATALVRRVKMRNCLTQRLTFTGYGQGYSPDPWLDHGVPPTYDVAQAIELPIVALGLRSMMCAWQIRDTARGSEHAEDLRAMIVGGALNLYDRGQTVRKWIAVARKDQRPAQNLVGVGGGGIESFNLWWWLGMVEPISLSARIRGAMGRQPLPGESVVSPDDLPARMLQNEHPRYLGPAYVALTRR